MGIQASRGTYLKGTGQPDSSGEYLEGAAMCSDGKVRKLKRLASEPDTVFSRQASVEVGGKTVSGYVMVETEEGLSTGTETDPAIVKFVAVTYGKNYALLPEGAWKRPANAIAMSGFRVMQLIDGDECLVGEAPTYEDARRFFNTAVRAAQHSTPAVRREDFSIWEVGGGIVGVIDPATGVLKRVMEDEPERGRER